jgi:hypothetical protein
MAEIKISNHARTQMSERGITEEMVMEIVSAPQQTVYTGRGENDIPVNQIL